MLVWLAAGRLALLVVAAGIFVLLMVIAALIAGAAFAPRRQVRESASGTLELLLRLVPGYRSRGRLNAAQPPARGRTRTNRGTPRVPAAGKLARGGVLADVISLTVTDQEHPGDSGSLPTHRADYPGIAEWLDGADPGHWWVHLLDIERYPAVTPPTLADMALGPLETLVQVVRAVGPKRLGQFVSSRFRDRNAANLLSARLELLCAAGLAIRHVPFEFGGKAEPDLTWNPGTAAQGWLEIHRGAFDVFGDFQQSLDSELATKGALLTVRLELWPLDIADRNLVHTRISRAVGAAVAVGANQTVALGELGDGATGRVELREEAAGIGRVVVQHAGITPSGRYLDGAAARLAHKVNVDKAGQGRKGKWDADRTVLLIDISTAYLAQLLGPDGLAAWLDGVPVEWEDLPFAGVAVCFSNLHSTSLWGSCRYRPELDAADRAYLEPVLSALGLPGTQHTQ